MCIYMRVRERNKYDWLEVKYKKQTNIYVSNAIHKMTSSNWYIEFLYLIPHSYSSPRPRTARNFTQLKRNTYARVTMKARVHLFAPTDGASRGTEYRPFNRTQKRFRTNLATRTKSLGRTLRNTGTNSGNRGAIKANRTDRRRRYISRRRYAMIVRSLARHSRDTAMLRSISAG